MSPSVTKFYFLYVSFVLAGPIMLTENLAVHLVSDVFWFDPVYKILFRNLLAGFVHILCFNFVAYL